MEPEMTTTAPKQPTPALEHLLIQSKTPSACSERQRMKIVSLISVFLFSILLGYGRTNILATALSHSFSNNLLHYQRGLPPLGMGLTRFSQKGQIIFTSFLAMSRIGSSSSTSNSSWEVQKRLIPPNIPKNRPLIIGYAHNAKSGKAERAILDGAHVIIWSFLHLDVKSEPAANEHPTQQHHLRSGWIRTDLDLEEIRRIRDKYKHVVHLGAFGGWNGPHPPKINKILDSNTSAKTSFSGKEWCDIFMEFNKDHGYLFDGIDWDYEGHDDLFSSTSKFTIETLDIMADFSVEAKQKHGMIVSMAPAESYLDSTIIPGSIDGEFSFELNISPRSWTSAQYGATSEDQALIQSVGFSHAGRQSYSYVLAKAGLETFDWISIQFYEAYSPFAHDLSRKKITPTEAIMKRVNALTKGYNVTNLPLPSNPIYEVKIPIDKLVLGVANGWADGLKFCRVDPPSLRNAYDLVSAEQGQGFLGIMFWTIEEEGTDGESRLAFVLTKAFESTDLQNYNQQTISDEL